MLLSSGRTATSIALTLTTATLLLACGDENPLTKDSAAVDAQVDGAAADGPGSEKPDAASGDLGAPEVAPPVDGKDARETMEGGADVGETGAPPVSAGFEVTVALSRDPAAPMSPSSPRAMLPPSDAFSLFVGTDPEPRLVASRTGTAGVAKLARQAGAWKTTEVFGLGATAGYNGVCFGVGRITYEAMELTFSANAIQGTVRGRAEFIEGDVVYSLPFVGTFTGAPDRSPPTASFEAATTHPQDGAVLLFSEALRPNTSASLIAPDGTKLALEGDTSIAYQTRFWTKTALAPGSSYTVAVEPSNTDLAGNTAAAAMLPTLATVAVPVIPEDGFEGMARPFLNAAEVVGAPTVPPIAGARSLLFPPREFSSRTSARFTARLAVAPADRVLRATVRMVVGDRNWRRASTMIRVAIPGGQQSTAMLPEAVDPLTCDGQGMAARCYAAAVPLEIPLPALGAREVLVDVNRQSTCGLPPPPEPGFLLDDLRVE